MEITKELASQIGNDLRAVFDKFGLHTFWVTWIFGDDAGREEIEGTGGQFFHGCEHCLGRAIMAGITHLEQAQKFELIRIAAIARLGLFETFIDDDEAETEPAPVAPRDNHRPRARRRKKT